MKVTDLAMFRQLRLELNNSVAESLLLEKLIRAFDHMADRIVYAETKIEALEMQVEALDETIEILMNEREGETE